MSDYDRWCVKNAFSSNKIQQLLDITTKRLPDSSIPNRVDTWVVEDTDIIRDELEYIFAGNYAEASVTIKTWYDTSRLHGDGNDFHYSVYVPLQTTATEPTSVVLFNAKWYEDYAIFDKSKGQTTDGKPVLDTLDGIQKVDKELLQGFDKYALKHIPKQFLDQIDVVDSFDFVVGNAYVWEPTYLHCSSFWQNKQQSRTHLLVALKLF
jgi:hypothetical protein